MSKRFSLIVICIMAVFVIGCGGSQTPAPTAPIAPQQEVSSPAPQPEPEPAPQPQTTGTMIADFNTSDHINALGGEFGAWESKGDAPEAHCIESIVNGTWKIDYDISNSGSYCGTWMKLNGTDGSKYQNLVIIAKGEGAFTPTFIVELKTDNGAKISRQKIEGLTSEWKTFKIALSSFRELPSLVGLYELTTVFDMQTCPIKKGTILIDSISLE